MKHEFQANVEKLFQTMVLVGGTGGYDVDKLVSILRRRATRPIRVDACADSVRLTYYNVSIIIARNLSAMQIVYNSDYQVTLRHIACADPYRLADFIAALEHDIPHWKHIWMAHDQLCREKVLMAQKVKNVMRNILLRWTREHTTKTPEEREECRLHFFNLKAHELMLEHDIPFWKNRKTEAEILEECLVYHITAPVERWLEEWTVFTEACDSIVEERQRIREEKERNAQKMQHLVSLQLLKMKAVLGNIELHPSVSIRVDKHFNIYPGATAPLRQGYFSVTLSLDDALVAFYPLYHQVNAVFSLLVNTCRKLNDLFAELQDALASDRQKHGNLYLCGFEIHNSKYNLSESAIQDYLFLSDTPFWYSEPRPHADLASTPILKQMNKIIMNFHQQTGFEAAS